MKFMKNGNTTKLVAFFLIAAALMCTVGFASGGWQSNVLNQPDSGNADEKTDDADENIDGVSPDNQGGESGDNLPVVNPAPVYYDYLTGLEISQEESFIKYCCFVLNSDAPMYGTSSNAITVEIPTEDGKTRFLVFKKDALTTGKIGSLAPGRKYISYVASFFDSLYFCNGFDDAFNYDIPSFENNALNFKETLGYSYTEYSQYVYTNGDLVNAFIKNSELNQVKTEKSELPFNFCELGGEKILGTASANNVIIPYSDSNSTELVFNKSTKKYVLSKNGQIKYDFLYDKQMEYDNLFVLFADSITYETMDATQSVLNTYTEGEGYYMTGGTMIKIYWKVSEAGELDFFNTANEKLTVNRGTSFISYVKSSQAVAVKIS